MARDILSNMYPLTWYNGSGQTIGAYRVFQLTADDIPDANNPPLDWPARLVGQLYDGSIDTEGFGCTTKRNRMLAINGPSAVLAGRYGKCSFAFDRPVWAGFSFNSYANQCLNSNVNINEDWSGVELGPSDTSNGELLAEGFGFVAVSQPDVNNDIILVRQIDQPAWAYFTIVGSGGLFPTEVYGDKDSGGVNNVGLCSQTDGVVDTNVTVEVNFTRTQGISFVGDKVFAINFGGTWYAIGAGQHTFNNCISGGGGATAYLCGTQVEVDCQSPLTGAVADGSACTVQWCHKTKTFIINGIGCPVV